MRQFHQPNLPSTSLRTVPGEALDCTRRGACCSGLAVHLTEREARIFPADRRLRPLIKQQGDAFGSRRTDREERCFALKGNLHRRTCKLYGQRLPRCRTFEAGSNAGLCARTSLGIN